MIKGAITRIQASQVVIGLIIIGISVVGLYLRLQMVKKTEVHQPIRADAAKYYCCAHNLKQYGVYSTLSPDKLKGKEPTPDAHLTPGYPLFLLPFVEFPPTYEMVDHILVTQAIISTLTILAALGFFRAFLTWPWALGAAFMVAISPHLVAVNTYLLTESLFTFFLVLFAWAMTRLVQQRNKLVALVAGLILGCALLVRPTLLYFLVFLIPALFLSFPRKDAMKFALFLLIGFSMSYGPWVIRNWVVNPTPSTLALNSIHKGIYPNLMYDDDPKTYGFPNKFDPKWRKQKNMSSLLKELLHRFEDEPLRYIYWYSIGKPIMFFSWDIIVGIGDVFIYPVFTSPYHNHVRLFDWTHRAMKASHGPVVVLALLTSILVWLPTAKSMLSDNGLIVARLASLIILYFIVVHIVGTPLPRYAIPLRAFIYGMAMLGLQISIDKAYRHIKRPKLTT